MKFEYKAKTKKGSLQTGNVEASSRAAGLEILQNNNLTVLSLKEKGGSESLFEFDLASLLPVPPKELVIFSRSLASLFDAGVPLVEAIRILSQETLNKQLSEVLQIVANDIDGGLPFSKAIEQHPRAFSNFYTSMIKTGEVSGSLQETLIFLADHLEKEFGLKKKIKSALAYPAFIIGVFVIVGLVIFVFVLPQLLSTLEQISGGNLPLFTRVLSSISGFMVQWFWAIIVLLLGLIGGLVYGLKTPQGIAIWHEIQLKLPVFGPLFRKIYQARFAENLSTLVKSGLPILEALHIVADVVDNTVYSKIINEVAEKVKTGKTIESVLRQYPEQFSPLLVQMVAVGEKSGKLDSILQKIAEFFQQEVEYMVATLSSLIEPLLIVVLGIGVGLMVGAVLIPMYSVITSAGSL